ncbi:MAG: hypothetical protein AMXMBFR23_04760 [Chloroflexota bacterium]
MRRLARIARRLRRRLVRWRRPIVAAVLLLLVLDVGWRAGTAGADLFRAYRDLSAAAAILDLSGEAALDALPSPSEYREVRLRVALAEERMTRAHARLAYLRPVVRATGYVPLIGPTARDATRMLDAGVEVTPALSRLLVAGAPLFEDPDAPLVQTARAVLVGDAEVIEGALDAIEAADADLARLEPERWFWPLNGRAEEVSRFSEAVAVLRQERETFEAVSDSFDRLFGYDGPVRWVVAGQNDQELRPTGGFMGSMGLVTLEQGEVAEQDYRSSVAFDPPADRPYRQPPAPLVQYLGIGAWYVRDANWWPNFPVSAEAVLTLMEEDAGVVADGVIAIDSQAVGLLVDVFGPLAVREYPEPLTSDNWFRLAEEAVTGHSGNADASNGTTAGWSTVEPNTLEAVTFADAGVTTEGLPEATLTGLRATVRGAARIFAYPVQLEPGLTYEGSVYVLIPEDWDGGGLLLDMPEFDGMEGGGAVALDMSVRGAWQRVATTGTTGGDGSGNVRLVTSSQPSPGRALYVTRVQVEVVGAEGAAQAAASQEAKQAYLRPVLEALLQQAQSAPASKLPALASALHHAARGRHLQVYHRDPETERALTLAGVSGVMVEGEGEELLAVVDSNVTYSKIQPAIRRDITVLVRADGGRDVIVQWRNIVNELELDRAARLGQSGTVFTRATLEYRPTPGVFGTYTRVYGPAGSTLQRTAGFDVPPGLFSVDEGDDVPRFMVGGPVLLMPGDSKRAIVSYVVPESRPRLRVWKQAGTVSDTLTVLQNVGDQQVTLYEGPLVADVVVELR